MFVTNNVRYKVILDGAEFSPPSNLCPPSTVRRRRTCDPWDADYPTSLETQRRIKLVHHLRRRRWTTTTTNTTSHVATATANNVLLALLDADPWECNAVIMVCALSLSSKMLVRREKQHPHPHHPRQWEGVGATRRWSVTISTHGYLQLVT